MRTLPLIYSAKETVTVNFKNRVFIQVEVTLTLEGNKLRVETDWDNFLREPTGCPTRMNAKDIEVICDLAKEKAKERLVHLRAA